MNECIPELEEQSADTCSGSDRMSRQKSQNGTNGSQNQLYRSRDETRQIRTEKAGTYVNQLGDDDSQVVEGHDGSLVYGGEDNGGLLADEELDVGDDFIQDDRDRTNDGRNTIESQVISGESLCREAYISAPDMAGARRNIRSCPVKGVSWVVASAKICGMLLRSCCFFTRAVSGCAEGAAKTETALSAKVARVAMDLNNIVEEDS